MASMFKPPLIVGSGNTFCFGWLITFAGRQPERDGVNDPGKNTRPVMPKKSCEAGSRRPENLFGAQLDGPQERLPRVGDEVEAIFRRCGRAGGIEHEGPM